MKRTFRHFGLFDGLDDEELSLFSAIARPRSLNAGEYLFLLGDPASRLYVVLTGNMDLCFPLAFGSTVKDVTIESASVGCALGWSALVEPYRFTLSARAAEPSTVVGFSRKDLLTLFEDAPHIGYAFVRKVSEIIGQRLLSLQALWAREIQRVVSQDLESRPQV